MAVEHEGQNFEGQFICVVKNMKAFQVQQLILRLKAVLLNDGYIFQGNLFVK